MSGGRNTVKLVSEKAAELAEKKKRQKRLVQLQQRLDLKLMRLTKTFNPLYENATAFFLGSSRW